MQSLSRATSSGAWIGRALLAAWVSAAVACDGGGRSALLSFEVSAPSESGCQPDTATLATGAPCTVLRMYRRRAGRLEPVPLYRSDADHATGQGALELRFDSRRIAFDAPLPEGDEHDLVIAVYVDRPWEPAYGAVLENVRLDQGTVRVRLHPYRRWACPGRVIDPDEQLEPRAFHRAGRVGNGDVLLLGGVTGQGIDPAGAGRPGRVNALLQRVVEVFVDEEHRFRRVEVPGGFGRALFDAAYVGRDPDGRHRVRAVGGLQTTSGREGAAVLAFDNSGLLAPLGAPFAPTEAAEAAPTVDLLYDAVARTLEVVPAAESPTGDTRGAAIATSEPLSGDRRATLVGLTWTGAGWLPATRYYPSGRPTGAPLAHQRLGASISPLTRLDAFLVWGGNLSTTPMVLETAGEIVDLAGGATLVPALDGLPAPVAFHTATPVAEGLLVVAGGLTVESSGTLRATPAADPLVGLQVSASGVELRDVDDTGYVSTILHTASEVPGLGVVLVGGAAVRALDGDRLSPVATVGHVGEALAYDGALQDLSSPRFGHTTTLLSGQRLLVVGGLGRSESGLFALSLPELMLLADPPHAGIADGQCVDQRSSPDAGVDAGRDGGSDAGAPDAGPPDAGGEDAGP